MTSRERVRRAIRFGTPDRIPTHLPEPYPTDIVWAFPAAKNRRVETRGGEQYRLSEWGSWWHVVSDENMGEVVTPAIEDWKEYEEYRFPDVNAPERYEDARVLLAQCGDKYRMGVLSASLFPHYWEIRGLMGFFEDLLCEPERMEAVLDRLVEIQLASLEIWSGIGVDGIVVGFDDWGLQDRLMIDPALWRKYFKPRYAAVWQAVRWHGLDVILHSCGDITSILGDMIDIGLDVINMDQQQNMTLARLGRDFAGKICFWNPVDIQRMMLEGTVEEIDRYVSNMIEALSTPQGGFIGKYYPQPHAAGHSEERSEAAFRAFIRHADHWSGQTAAIT